MKKEDFKKITEKHVETARIFIKLKGSCAEINCEDCPFWSDNSTLTIDSCGDLYSTGNNGIGNTDEKLLQSAREFLEMCKKTGAITGEGTAEKSISGEVSVDNINSPKHYRLPGLNIESIDIIRAILGKYFKWFCLGNIIKYVLRAEKKNGLEDYKKARKYLDWLIKGEEK